MHPARRHIRTITALYPSPMPAGLTQSSFHLVQTYALKPVVMIEIFDSSCSRSLGQSASIRAAIDILNAPSAAGRPGMTPIGALFPNKNIPLSATTGSGICKEPAKSRFAIPCRITSAVKRSGICQTTIGCRRFVRNLRFSPAAERCTAEVCPSRSAST